MTQIDVISEAGTLHFHLRANTQNLTG